MMRKESSFKIINSVLKFELIRGHLKWKVTDIARVTGVQRSLIYYHFGRTKKEIFDHCLDIISSEFYGTSNERMKLLEEGKLFECVSLNFQMFRASPEFIVFYNKARVKKSPIQDRLIEIEKNYQKKLERLFPFLTKQELTALHSVIQGAVSSPILNTESFEIVMKSIISPFIIKRSNLRNHEGVSC